MQRQFFVAIILSILMTSLPALAQDNNQSQALEVCVSIDDALDRLECYDQAMGRAAQDQGAVAQLKKDLVDAKKRAEKAEAKIQAAEDKARVAEEEARLAEEKERARLAEIERKSRDQFGFLNAEVKTVDVITAKITKVKEKRGQRTVITLDNGQIWRLIEETFRGVVRKNYDVIIKKAALESHKMIIEKNGRVLRVKRVK